MRGRTGTLCLGLAGLFLLACTGPTTTSGPTASDASPPTAPPSAGPAQPTSSHAPPPTVEASPTGPPTPSAVPSAVPTATQAPNEPPSATPLEPGGRFNPDAIRLSVEPFASGFRPLTLLTNAADGSGVLYAVEQRGVIWTLDAQGAVQANAFLAINERIKSGGEQGLLGLAFHPGYESNGRFFVNYTNTAGDTVISEFGRAADGLGDPASERVLLTIDQPFSNHNGGMLAFGPNGYLYIATGDGGSGGDPRGNGQRLDTLLGKILRIDVDSGDPYGIPADNPFAAGGGQPEIWSYGLRNPWRFTFDRATDAMFIGDVGQDEREEIDVEPPGAGGRNYGWNVVEGDRCYARSQCDRSGLTAPVATYGRDGNCSVTGGYVYRGAQHPDLYGGYVFSDYCSGTLWALDAQRAINTGSAPVFDMGDTTLSPSSFGEDESGAIYIVGHSGEIHRLVTVAR